MQVISRTEALHIGSARYFTGKPCPKGHMAERFVSSRGCTECAKDNKNEWRIENNDYIEEYMRAWRASKPSDYFSSYSEEWRHDNPDKVIAWRKNNPDKMKAQKRRRRAKELNAPGYHTAKEASNLLVSQRYECANTKCGADLRVVAKNLDHNVPLTRGGGDSIHNLQWLCERCNKRKRDKTMHEFIGSTRPFLFCASC